MSAATTLTKLPKPASCRCAGWPALPDRHTSLPQMGSAAGVCNGFGGAAQLCPGQGIESSEFLEGKTAPQTRCPVESHLDGFQEESTAPAHGVYQRSARLPAGQLENARRQVFPRGASHRGPAQARCQRGAPRVSMQSEHSLGR